MTTESEPISPTRAQRASVAPGFCTTRWTYVRMAKADSDEGRQALADLCDAYYQPVVTFLRCELRDADAAQELAHAFFAHVLGGSAIHTAERQQGRFRSYLLGAVKHFLSHHRASVACVKRGGGLESLSLDDPAAASVADSSQRTPDAEFDRQWAVTLITRALEGLRHECTAEGKVAFFDHVKPWLMGESTHGEQAALAELLGMSPASLKMAVHRLKQRFRQCVKTEVSGTLDDPAMIDEEMQSLFAALGG